MNIQEAALATATFKALSDLVKERDQEVRRQMFETLLTAYDEMGVKSLDVKLPDGTKVASLSLTIPKGKGAQVVDQKAFNDWVRENYPAAIYQPPTPAPYISEAWKESFLSKLAPIGEDLVVDEATGELVPGVAFTAPPAPKSFSVRFVADGKPKLIEAFKADLASGADPLALPEGE